MRREDLSQGASGNSLQDAAMIRWHLPGKGWLPLAALAPASPRRARISSSPALCLVWACLVMGQQAEAAMAEGPPPLPRRPVDAGAVGIVVQDSEPLPGDLRSRSADAPCSVLIRIGADALAAPERIDPLLDAAAAASLRIAVGISLAGWERSAPGEVDVWATRAGAFARHVGGRVAAYQILERVAPDGRARDYAYLLKHAAVAIRAADPRARIVSAALRPEA